MNEVCLVMTACVEPKQVKYLSLREQDVRLQQYREAITFYILSGCFDRIVFCDNSNFLYSYEDEIALAQKCSIRLEILRYEENEVAVYKFGKGFGEGHILKYIYQNSRLLQECDYFYKVTGRLIVENIKSLVASEQDGNYFNLNCYSRNTIDTRFFCVNKLDFARYLLNVYYYVKDVSGYYLEHAYADAIFDNHMKIRCHKKFPMFKGVSATVGQSYCEYSKKTLPILQILCVLGIFNTQVGYKIGLSLIHSVTERSNFGGDLHA